MNIIQKMGDMNLDKLDILPGLIRIPIFVLLLFLYVSIRAILWSVLPKSTYERIT